MNGRGQRGGPSRASGERVGPWQPVRGEALEPERTGGALREPQGERTKRRVGPGSPFVVRLSNPRTGGPRTRTNGAGPWQPVRGEALEPERTDGPFESLRVGVGGSPFVERRVPFVVRLSNQNERAGPWQPVRGEALEPERTGGPFESLRVNGWQPVRGEALEPERTGGWAVALREPQGERVVGPVAARSW